MTDCEADDLLVAKLCEGETAAARVLYQRHGAALLRFGLAMSRSRHTAEDAVHDTFVEFLREPRAYDPARGSVAAFLYGIARHRLSRAARRADVGRVDDSSGVALAAVPDVVAAADEQIDHARLIERVRRAVLDLPASHREVVALCDLAELPYATVAAILDCPIGTVRSRLHRARALLAAQLDAAREAPARNAREAGAPGECASDRSALDEREDGAAAGSTGVRFACRGTPT